MIIIKDIIADYKYRLQKTKPAKIMYGENDEPITMLSSKEKNNLVKLLLETTELFK